MAETEEVGEPVGASVTRFLVEAGIVAAYLGTVLFIAGWSYRDWYFALLGLNISALDPADPNAYSIYALWVFRDQWLAVLLFGLVAAVGVGGIVLLRVRIGAAWRSTLAGAVVLMALGGVILSAWLGQLRAEAQVPAMFTESYRSFPRVVLVAKDDKATARFLSAKKEPTTCLRKLFMDGRHVYVYPGYQSWQDRMPPIYVLPLRDLAAIEIVTNRGLCAP